MTGAAQPRGAFSWGLYDLANTIYSMNVLSLFFAQWVTVDRAREDLWFSLFFSGSMLAVALTLPYLGMWSDRGGQRLRFLAAFTVVAVASTASLGWATRVPGLTGLVLALSLFALSNYAFQGGIVFYNALLPAVSAPAQRGRVSGLGVALGYIGSFLGMLLVVPFVDGTMPLVGWSPPFLTPGGRSAAFLPTALLFALFSLPIFLRVREPKTSPGPRPRWRDSLRTIRDVFVDARRYPGVGWFLLGNFFLLDAIHTGIIFMAVFAQKVVGLPDSAKVTFFMLATVPAIGGSFIAGWLTDRIGARRVLIATAWAWVVCLLVIAAVPNVTVFYTMGAIVGFMLGSVWTASRPLLLQLTPRGEEGSLFGAYAFCNKSAAVLGPQLWGLTVLLASSLGSDKYRLALALLGGLATVGALFLHRVPERPRVRPDMEPPLG